MDPTGPHLTPWDPPPPRYAHGRVAAQRAHACRLWVRNDTGVLCYANLASRSKKEKTVCLTHRYLAHLTCAT